MWKANLAQICIVVSLLFTASLSQEPPSMVPSSSQEAQEPHKFFDKQNIALWSGVAVAHALDCDSTWRMLNSGNGREAELPTSLAQSRVGMTLFGWRGRSAGRRQLLPAPHGMASGGALDKRSTRNDNRGYCHSQLWAQAVSTSSNFTLDDRICNRAFLREAPRPGRVG